eukprot:3078156-Rhodomonas_salina.2
MRGLARLWSRRSSSSRAAEGRWAAPCEALSRSAALFVLPPPLFFYAAEIGSTQSQPPCAECVVPGPCCGVRFPATAIPVVLGLWFRVFDYAESVSALRAAVLCGVMAGLAFDDDAKALRPLALIGAGRCWL